MVCFRLNFVLIVFVIHKVNSAIHPLPGEERSDYWFNAAQQTLKSHIKIKRNENVAKNLIFFLGDGMGMSTVTAARIFQGQQNNRPGEEGFLEFEKFPDVGLVKTYNVDRQVPDSAGTATAYLCGVKAKYETIGVSAKVIHKNCDSVFGNEVTSILQWAQMEGKDTGFVTTARVTHASPAGLYAHVAFRDWEADYLMPPNSTKCKDIARQLVEDEPGNNIKVIMGGGRKYFYPEGTTSPKTVGRRKDGKNLGTFWKESKVGRNAQLVFNKKEFDDIDYETTDYLFGLFDDHHMQYESDRNTGPDGQPSLAEMTKKAIEILQKSQKGFFLFIEGGRIDHAHHDAMVRRSLEETVAFSDAIKKAVEMVDVQDTLIVVTADHSHVMTINGYPQRGNPILGTADTSDMDNMTYTTLMYTNGPGYPNNGSQRANLLGVNTESLAFTPQVAVHQTEETHGGEDVAIYARGPMSHLFRSVVEQNYIPHAMAYAACIGANREHCREQPREVTYHSSASYKLAAMRAASSKPSSTFLLIISSILISCFLMNICRSS
ncbi:hypothetical protein CHUAL_010245 [Chamberlinius hualienensis]